MNRNGKSDPAILEGFSLKVAELQIGKIVNDYVVHKQARDMVMKMSDDRLICTKKFRLIIKSETFL